MWDKIIYKVPTDFETPTVEEPIEEPMVEPMVVPTGAPTVERMMNPEYSVWYDKFKQYVNDYFDGNEDLSSDIMDIIIATIGPKPEKWVN